MESRYPTVDLAVRMAEQQVIEHYRYLYELRLARLEAEKAVLPDNPADFEGNFILHPAPGFEELRAELDRQLRQSRQEARSQAFTRLTPVERLREAYDNWERSFLTLNQGPGLKISTRARGHFEAMRKFYQQAEKKLMEMSGDQLRVAAENAISAFSERALLEKMR